MPASRPHFSHHLWRFNAYIIAVAGLIAIVVGLAGLFEIGRSIFRTRYVSNLVAAPTPSNLKEPTGASTRDVIAGKFALISGTPWSRAPLRSKETRAQGRYSKVATSIRNYLFYNSKTRSFHRLFTTDDKLILREHLVRGEQQKASGSREAQAHALIYQVIEKDSNRDGILSSRDERALIIATRDGRPQLTINQVHDMLGVQVTGDNQLVVFVQRSSVSNKPEKNNPGQIVAIHIALDNFKITHEQSAGN